ncbi:Uncharacterized protein dnm_064280 [Desulfonema magnum]|uniref:Uncharacterized protein n=1 Tax=Desulfonema magnum TaxID=45655 RepID=A0A975BRH3_9BACT|nr:Uncharacterized protein dnm_064280 [Desulfonema magnum]
MTKQRQNPGPELVKGEDCTESRQLKLADSDSPNSVLVISDSYNFLTDVTTEIF